MHHRGRLHDAESLYRQTLANLRIVLERGPGDQPQDLIDVHSALPRASVPPDEHHDLNDVKLSLGGLLVERGTNPEEALRFLKEVLEYRRTYGKPVGISVAMMQLGLALLAQGYLEVAEDYLEQSHVTLDSVVGPDHPATIRSLNALARGIEADQRLEEAVTLFEEAATTAQRVLPDHWRAAVYRGDYGACLSKLGRYAQARELLKTSHDEVVNQEVPVLLRRRTRREGLP